MRCFRCGSEADNDASVCPNCLYRLKAENAPSFTAKKRKFSFKPFIPPVIIAAVIVICILAIPRGGLTEIPEDNLFSQNLTTVFSNKYWGYADVSGKERIEPQYSFASAFSKNNLAAVITKEGDKFGYINKSGKMVLGPYEYNLSDPIDSFSEDGLAFMADENGRYGYIDKNGNWAIKAQYTEAKSFSNGFAAVRIGDKYGFIDTKGIVICDFIYEYAGDFSKDGLAAFKDGGKWGYINSEGEVVIDAIYDEAYDFCGGLAAVKHNGEWSYINTEGKEAITIKADELRDFSSSGLAAFCLNGRWGYINTRGDTVIDAQFKEADKFSKSGYAAVRTDNGVGIIDKKGRFVTKDDYYSMSVYDDGYAVFSEDGTSYGVMECINLRTVFDGYSFISYDRTYNYINFDRYYKY